jgi:hypothetical protein
LNATSSPIIIFSNAFEDKIGDDVAFKFVFDVLKRLFNLETGVEVFILSTVEEFKRGLGW